VSILLSLLPTSSLSFQKMSSFSSLLASANEMRGDNGSSTLNRTLDELNNTSYEGPSVDYSHSNPGTDRAAHQLLARSAFDSQAFEASVMDLEFNTRTNNNNKGLWNQNNQQVQGDDLYSYLRHHHDMIVSTALSDTQSATLSHATTLMQKRRVEDWSNEKMRLLHDLAGRRSGKVRAENGATAKAVYCLPT